MVSSTRRPGVPAYLRHKASGQAFAVVRTQDGRRKQVYLGSFDSPESHRRYRELLSRYLDPAAEAPEVESRAAEAVTPWTVADVVARFLSWADRYFRRPDGAPTREYPNYHAAARLLLQLYRDEVADEFGPLKLKRVRELMVERGWARRTVNKQVGRLKRVFKWAVENELVGPAVFARLQAVAGLKFGRTSAQETKPVRPVAWESVEPVLPRVSRIVGAMILVQWYSGMRPNEVVQMRGSDLDRSGAVWVYRPHDHKTAYCGRDREVFLGPEAQRVVSPFLKGDPDVFLFQPGEAEAERRQEQRLARVTPLWPSHLRRLASRRATQSERVVGPRYSVDSYRRAIHRACAEAGIEPWSPNRLRHSRATEVRRQYGLEAAQVTLGHASADVTQVYAERDRELARRVAMETG